MGATEAMEETAVMEAMEEMAWMAILSLSEPEKNYRSYLADVQRYPSMDIRG